MPSGRAGARSDEPIEDGLDEPGVLLGAGELRALAARLGLRPRKSLGQNFVHDGNTIRRIVRAAGVRPSDRVLEVGPGLGSLTIGLLAAGAEVTAVEVDPRLAAQLPDTVRARAPRAVDRLRVVPADALRIEALDGPPPTALVANLPYNVAVPVLLHLLGALPSLRGGLVLVQAEVADRLVAQAGESAYGAPSAKLAWHAAATSAGSVPRSVFWPVPNVDSALVRLACRPAPSGASRHAVFAVIDAAFAQRRKMLRQALAPWAGSSADAVAMLRAAGIDPAARGETLDLDNFVRIAHAAARA